MKTHLYLWAPAVLLAVLTQGCSYLAYEKDNAIWVMGYEGSKPRQLADPGESPQSYAAKGTAPRVAYLESKAGVVPLKLRIINADGKNGMALTGFEVHRGYSWSPDGQWIAVADTKDGNSEIYKIAPTTGAATRLTQNAVTDHFPVWSPSGNLIAFLSSRDGAGDAIYVMKPDGTGEQRVTPPGFRILAHIGSQLSWSPDGKQLAFIGLWPPNYDVGTVDLATGVITRVTNAGHAMRVCWAASGGAPYLLWFYADSTLYCRDPDGAIIELGHFQTISGPSNLTVSSYQVFFSLQTQSSPGHHIFSSEFPTRPVKPVVDLGEGRNPSYYFDR